jgi:hypothetical protein
MITCTHCRKLFVPLFNEPCTQAMDCSSEIFEREGKKFMIGCYGSKLYDGELYEVLTNKFKTGIICDACITDNKQDFKLLRDNQHFGIDL